MLNRGFRYFILIVGVMILFSIPISSAGIFDWVKTQITGRATSQNVDFNITVGSFVPNITNVDPISAVTLIENGSKSFFINFTAFDSDGSANLRTSAILNISKSGETTRYNYSCSQINTYDSYYANYSCMVSLWYFDGYGTWNVGISINDTSNLIGYNTSAVFTVNQLTAFVSGPNAITFGSINPGSRNITSNNDPITLNNTGNDPIGLGNIELNATNLLGETDNSKGLYASNFTVGIVTGSSIECSISTNQTSVMNRSVYTPINNASLTNGNFSVNDGSTGQEQLYVCLRNAGSELSSQSYSTAGQGSWMIRVS